MFGFILFFFLENIIITGDILLELFGFLFISILGTVLHFTYDFSNHDKYASLFSAVNESVWEHMKLAVFPSLLWLLIEVPFLKNNSNFLLAKCISLIVIILLIPTLYYLAKYIFGKNITWIDILIFYVSVGFGQICSYIVLNIPKAHPTFNYLSLIIMILIYGYFLIATLIPGESEIYLDPLTNKKGILGHRKK